MAQTQGMSYQQIINAIQLQTLNDPTPPNSSSQEYAIYVNMIRNLAIPAWENERGTLWNELWVDVPFSDNYATITVGQNDIALPDDFKFIGGGYIRLYYTGSTATNPIVRPFPVKMLPEIELNPRVNVPEFYIYGNVNTGFFLRPGWIVNSDSAEAGATVAFRYYKYAAIPDLTSAGALSNPSDVPEMSDPMFIVYKVSAQVSANNFNMNLYQINEDKANYSLTNMRMANDMASNFMDDYVKDIDGLTGMGSYIPSKMTSAYWTGKLEV